MNKKKLFFICCISFLFYATNQAFQNYFFQSLQFLIEKYTPINDLGEWFPKYFTSNQKYIKEYYKNMIQGRQQGTDLIRKNQKLAYGYVSDLDIFIDAVELMQSLGYQQPPQIDLENHQIKMETFEDIVNSFAYYYLNGASSELFIKNQSDFEQILFAIEDLDYQKQGYGGTSSMMALRGYKQQTEVILGAAINQKYYQLLFDSNITVAGGIDDKISDIHLVLNFWENQHWGQKQTPRSNRVYMNHDQENPYFKRMQQLTELILSEKPSVFAIGGFQLLCDLEQKDLNETFNRLEVNLFQIKKDVQIIKIHIEMGSIRKQLLMDQLVKSTFFLSDSIGLNQQELFALNNMLSGKLISQSAESFPDPNTELSRVSQFIELIQEYQFNLNRVHYHSPTSHILCASQEWENTEIAMVQAITVAAQMSMKQRENFFDFNEEEIEIQVSGDLLIPSFDNDQKQVKFEARAFSPEQPTNCWTYDAQFKCCTAPTIFFTNPLTTQGLGDNISSTGLVYNFINTEKITK